MALDFQHARTTPLEWLRPLPLTKWTNSVVGQTADRLIRPTPSSSPQQRSATLLVLNVEVGDFLFVPGRYQTSQLINAADPGTDTLTTFSTHFWETGDGPIRLTTGGTLPSPLVVATNYWVIHVDTSNLKLATSYANAKNGIAIDLTTTGSGLHGIGAMPANPASTITHGFASLRLVTGIHLFSAPDVASVEGTAAGSKMTYWYV